jgi:WD40 repeat protein
MAWPKRLRHLLAASALLCIAGCAGRPPHVDLTSKVRQAAVVEGRLPFPAPAFAASNDELLTIGATSCFLWSAPNWRRRLSLPRSKAPTWFAARSPDGELMATASFKQGRTSGAEINIWRVGDGAKLFSLASAASDLASLCWDPRGGRLAACFLDGSVRLWQADAGSLLADVKTKYGDAVEIEMAPDGTLLASSFRSGDVTSVRPDDEVSVVSHHVDSTAVYYACFDPTARFLVTSGRDGTKVWAAKTLQLVASRPSGRRPLGVYANRPEEPYVVVVDADWSVQVCPVPDVAHATRTVCPASKDMPYAATVSPDGRWLLLLRDSGSVSLHDLRSGSVTADGLGNTGADWMGIRSSSPFGAFSPDSAVVAIAEQGGRVGLWQLPGMRPLADLAPSIGEVTEFAFSPDSRYLATGSAEWVSAKGRYARTPRTMVWRLPEPAGVTPEQVGAN